MLRTLNYQVIVKRLKNAYPTLYFAYPFAVIVKWLSAKSNNFDTISVIGHWNEPNLNYTGRLVPQKKFDTFIVSNLIHYNGKVE